MMTSLINVKKTGISFWFSEPSFIYIGRANQYLNFKSSKWQNPFPMKNEGQRIEVLTDFLEYMMHDSQVDLIDDLCELDGKTLGCYCAPKKCHGDVLIRLRALQIENRLDDWKEILDWIKG